MARPWHLLLVCIVVSTSAQVLLKMGVQDVGGVGLTGGRFIPSMIRILKSPYIWGGVITYGSGFYLWLVVLSKFAFHEANLFFSLNKIIMLIIAIFVFGETITKNRWIGAGLIIAGAFVMSLDPAPTPETATPPAAHAAPAPATAPRADPEP